MEFLNKYCMEISIGLLLYSLIPLIYIWKNSYIRVQWGDKIWHVNGVSPELNPKQPEEKPKQPEEKPEKETI
jgi:hypothetical protein